MRILVFGLPDSGKTTLAREIAYHFNIPHYNADTIREFWDDWDFSVEGRRRQLERMNMYPFGVFDFICPLNIYREELNPDVAIWMDTLKKSIYDDTNQLFETPRMFNFRITEWIGQNQLRSSLEDFNPGIKDILPYFREHFQKLVK